LRGAVERLPAKKYRPVMVELRHDRSERVRIGVVHVDVIDFDAKISMQRPGPKLFGCSHV
jgi:hypothetical protein